MVIGLGAALLAAVLFGVASVVQAVAARRHGLFSALMVLVGVTYLLGWGLHLVAIAHVPLYVAQVGIAASLVVTALIAARVVHEPLAVRHWVAIAAMVVGLALLVGAAGPVGDHLFDTDRTLALYVGFGLTLLLGVAAVMRLHSERGGVLLGVLAGIAYGGSPIATRSLVHPGWNSETIAPAFTIALFGAVGFWLYSVALQRASVTAASAPLVLLETLLPAVVGVVVFGDGVRPGWWSIAVIGFVLSIAGALVLCGAETRLHLDDDHHPEPVGDSQLI
jgi:drug/metabolite transporter (DMT)-like permease